MANIGIMDGAYFVSRSDIISWINSTLQLNIAKVEEVRAYPRHSCSLRACFCVGAPSSLSTCTLLPPS